MFLVTRRALPGQLVVTSVRKLRPGESVIFSRRDLSARRRPALAWMPLRLSKDDRAALDRHVDVPLEADLRQDRLGKNDALRVADAQQRGTHLRTTIEQGDVRVK